MVSGARAAVDLLSNVRGLDRRIAEATATLSAAVTVFGITRTELRDIGDVIAAKILAVPASSTDSGRSPRSPRTGESRR